jgi:opacity protein-like surface antigen
MLKRLMFGVSAVALSMVFAGSAQAQAHVGVSAGVSMPTSSFGDSFKTGYNVTGLVSFSAPMIPVGLRGEFGYNRFDIDGGGGNARILNGAVNVLISTPSASMIKPYVTGGLGAYNTKVSFDDSFGGIFGASQSKTKLGFNGGVGISFGLTGFQTQLEARYVYITADNDNDPIKYVPISFGVMF